MRRLPTALLLSIGLFAAGCGGDDAAVDTAEAYDVVTEASLAPGDDVPAPTGEVLLTITGDIDVTNQGDALVLDMATIESLGTVEYTVEDVEAEGGEVTFTGVLLEDVLALAGMGDDAATLHTGAVNDYTVDIPATDVTEYPVLLATRVDGERMTIERFGPLRVVYPTHAFDLEPTVYGPRWIWQLVTIDVR